MHEDDLLRVLRQGEDSRHEFKDQRVHPDDLAATIVAMANSEGGYVLIGVSDDGTPIGVDNIDL